MDELSLTEFSATSFRHLWRKPKNDHVGFRGNGIQLANKQAGETLHVECAIEAAAK